MKKFFVFAFVMAVLSLSVLTAAADQDGNKLWCNIDKFGCYETAEDGSTLL